MQMEWEQLVFYFVFYTYDLLILNQDVNALQQQGGILRSKYHYKQQRKKFPKTHCCEP
jgi:hypothetical protein